MRLPKVGISVFGKSGASAPNGSPSSCTLTVISDTELQVDWTNGATNQDGTYVLYKLHSASEWSTLTALGALETKNITGLTPNTLYYVKVAHYKGSNLSGYSNIDNETTYTTAGINHVNRLSESTPYYYVKKVIKETFASLENAGLLAKFDVIVLSKDTSANSLLNFFSSSFDGDAVNNPVFTYANGWQMVFANSQYLSPNYSPRTQGSQYSLNSASFFVIKKINNYTTTAIKGNGAFSTTADGGISNRISIFTPHTNYVNYAVALNSGATASASTENIAGILIATRINTALKLFLNKVLKVSATSSATKIPDQEPMIGAYHLADGSIGNFSDDQFFGYGFGSGLTDGEVEILNDILQTYMDNIGGEEVYDGIFENSIDYFTRIRNAKSKFRFSYDGEYISVKGNSTMYPYHNLWSKIRVYVNGVYNQSITIDDSTYKRIMLPAGSKEIVLVEDITSYTGVTADKVFGTFINSIRLSNEKAYTFSKLTESSVANSLIIFGDSIYHGVIAVDQATDSIHDKWYEEGKNVSLYGGSSGELYYFASDAGKITTTVANFVNLLQYATSKNILIGIGTNDAGLARHTSAANFITWYSNLLDAIHVADSSIHVYCMSPLFRNDSWEADRLVDYRSGMVTMCSTRDYTTYINGLAICSYPSEYQDNIHPNTAGQVKLFNALDSVIYP